MKNRGTRQLTKLEELEFKIALSYPGDKRDFVRIVADVLQQNLGQDTIFYDEFYTHDLSGFNTDTLLQDIYSKRSKLIVVFLCKEYKEKRWCGLEWRVIRDMSSDNNVMLFRFDDEPIPGITKGDFAIDASKISPNEAAEHILKRFKGTIENGFPFPENYIELEKLETSEESINWNEFFNTFSIWRARNLGLNLDYSILIDCSGTMTFKDNSQSKTRIQHAKEISMDIIDKIHSEERYDRGSIYSFGEHLNLLIRSSKKQNLISKIHELIISNDREPTRLWDSLLDVIHKYGLENGTLNNNYILVLTDGYDNVSRETTSSYPGCQSINDHIEIAKQHNEICFRQILEAYKKNNDTLPFIFLVALAGELEQPIWSMLKNNLNATEFSSYVPISINFSDSIQKVKNLFRNHIISIKTNLVRVGTVENWVWSLTDQKLPIPRSIIYPGALLATLIQRGDCQSSSKIWRAELKNKLIDLMIEIKDIEKFEPLGISLVENLSEDRYYSFLSNLDEQKLALYIDLILSAAEKLGWLFKDNSQYFLEIMPGSLAEYLIKEYFGSGKWEKDIDNQFLKNGILPNLKQKANQLQIDFPIFTVNDIKDVLIKGR